MEKTFDIAISFATGNFYRIFGMESRYAILLVSEFYVRKEVPMEEAGIAFSKHGRDASVIPVYIDGTPLPKELLDAKKQNYFSSNNAAEIAAHVASKVSNVKENEKKVSDSGSGSAMINKKNKAETQIFIQNYNRGRNDG